MTVNTVYFEGADGGVSPFSNLSPPFSSPALLLYPSHHLVSFPSPFLLSPVFTLLPPFPSLPLLSPRLLTSSLSAPS